MEKYQIYLAFVNLSLLLVSLLSAGEVVVLTEQNFDKEVGQERGALVEFYTPWCGHCQKLAPEFETLAESFKKVKSVLIGKMDCDEHKSICTKYGVQGYPTILWFPKGSSEPTTYDGARNAVALTFFLNMKGGTNVRIPTVPSSVVVLNGDTFDEVVLDKSKDVLVQFYAQWCGHCKTLAPIYEKVASTFKMEEDVVIAKLEADKHNDLAGKYGVSGFPTLKFFPKSNKAGEDYNGGRKLEDFVTFINEKCGTSRNAKGQLSSKVGILSSLDPLVKDFVAATGNEKKIVFTNMSEEVQKLNDSPSRYGNIYERLQLQRILDKLISAAKADEFRSKPKHIIAKIGCSDIIVFLAMFLLSRLFLSIMLNLY